MDETTIKELEAALRQNLRNEEQWSVYADWLESRGDTRGELIRFEQRADAARDPAEGHRWRQRAKQLFARDHQKWLGSLSAPTFQPVWTRGFASEATILARPLAFTRALLDSRVSALLWRISYDRVDNATLAAVSAMLAGSSVEVIGLTRAHVTRVAPLAAVPQLRELFVDRARLDDLESLADLPELERLCLRHTQLDLDRLEGGFASLRHLELVECSDPDASSMPLRELARLERIETLSLRRSRIEGVEHLADLPRLRRLDLSGINRALSLAAIVDVPLLERLDVYASECRWDRESLARLEARGVEIVRDPPAARQRLEEVPPWDPRAR